MSALKKKKSGQNKKPEGGDQLAVWTLRTLLRTSVVRRFKDVMDDEDVVYAIGVTPKWIQEARKSKTKKKGTLSTLELEENLRSALEQRLRYIEDGEISRDEHLFDNVEALAKAMGLNTLEKDLLAYAILGENDAGLSECWDKLPNPQHRRLFKDLAAALDVSVPEIHNITRSDAPLISTGLLEPKTFLYDGPYSIRSGLDSFLLRELEEGQDVLSFFFERGKESSLTVEDYPHIHRDSRLIVEYLKQASDSSLIGANVLIYGPPGTGKTEFARVVASATGLNLFEVNVMDWEGDAMTGRGRLSSYLTSQKILSNRHRSLILFDEIEDVFSGAFGKDPFDNPLFLKGHFNRILESNRVPAIWITNNIENMDRAFLRRFDYALEMPLPPRNVRRNILIRKLGKVAEDPTWLDRVAASETLTPADVDRAARIISVTGAEKKGDARQVAKQVISSALSVRGERLERTQTGSHLEYDPSLACTDFDVLGLIEGMKTHRRGSICLYGQPGTGKTGFTRYIAKSCGLELLAYRASDLLGKYVGETETRIAQMFERARPRKDLLFLDEADSFFRDRRNSKQRWEVTQVNELLVQMESFDGLFIAATNLVLDFDQASFRRFAAKIKFDFMRPKQAFRMFERTCTSMDIDMDNETRTKIEQELSVLSRLTPGDFDTVRRRFSLLGTTPTAFDILSALRQELSHKRLETHGNRIGFGKNEKLSQE